MPTDDALAEALAEARRATRDQVAATWQTQMDRIRDLTSRDWREQITKIVDEHFTQFEAKLKPQLLEARRDVVRSLGQHWNECIRMMVEAPGDREWCDAVLDAAAGLCKRCAFFSVRGDAFSCQGYRGFQPSQIPDEVPLAAAPAFRDVIVSGQAADVSRSAQALSGAVAEMLGDSPTSNGSLIPVLTNERVMGVIYAENALERTALESIALVAGVILDGRMRSGEVQRPSNVVKSLMSDEPVRAATQPCKREPAADRAARVHAAQLLLAHRKDTGAQIARDAVEERRRRYSKEFPQHADYLEQELARTGLA